MQHHALCGAAHVVDHPERQAGRGVGPRADGDRPSGDGAAEIETAILERSAAQIAAAIGPGATLVELGAGAYGNTARLLAALDAPKASVAVHGSADASGASIGTLRAAFTMLPMHTLVGELGDPATLAPLRRTPDALGRAARAARPWGRRLGFLPGSTIGHYAPDAAATLLDRIGQTLGSDALLVVGVDSTPDPTELLACMLRPTACTQRCTATCWRGSIASSKAISSRDRSATRRVTTPSSIASSTIW